MLIDKKFRLPRIWSNNELKKFGHLFSGNIVNVSGWKDIDKEGCHYKDYFIKSNSYTITNFKKEKRGFQGYKGEIFLDLEKDIPKELLEKYNVVFNHTTLEHIYDFKKAFNNLCSITNDIIILVVPFLQQMHSDYEDYWRFTPLAIKKMFEKNKMKVLYSSFNEHQKSSIYLFFIASKKPNLWNEKIHNEFTYESEKKIFLDGFEKYVGCRSIHNSFFYNLFNYIGGKIGIK